jgi:ATP-dependent RNA circularization protein (DNA/RNA ligase family)
MWAMYRSCVRFCPLNNLAELADGPNLYVRCQGEIPRHANVQVQIFDFTNNNNNNVIPKTNRFSLND